MGRQRPADTRPAGGQWRRDALLGAAMRLFGERGFDGTSTRAIAAAAGCNIGLISFYFGSKEGLYDAVRGQLKADLRAIADPLVQRVRALLAQDAAPPVLTRALRREVRDVLCAMLRQPDNQTHFLLLRRSLHAGDEGARELCAEVFLPLISVIHQACDAILPGHGRENHLRAFLLIDMVIGIVRDYPVFYASTGREAAPEEDALPLADILCGLLPSLQPAEVPA